MLGRETYREWVPLKAGAGRGGEAPAPSSGQGLHFAGLGWGTSVHPDAWDLARHQGSGEDTRRPFWQEGCGLGGRPLRGRIHC